MPDDQPPSSPVTHAAQHRDSLLGVAFPTTHWSLVQSAQKDGALAAQAMNELCRRYWYPIYAYLRCRGFDRPDAQDITQGFFLHIVTGGLLQHADRSHGKLRSYLLGALGRHLADHLRHERAEKRGGRAIVLPLEVQTAEERFQNEPIDRRDPESLYLAAWAQELLARVQGDLRTYYTKTSRADLFDALQACLGLDDTLTPYAGLATRFSTSETAMRLQVFRMRRRFGTMLRDEVARTVETPAELEEELAWLSKVLRGG